MDGEQSELSWLALPLAIPRHDLANLQSYLTVFVYLFRVRQAQDRWPKTVSARWFAI